MTSQCVGTRPLSATLTRRAHVRWLFAGAVAASGLLAGCQAALRAQPAPPAEPTRPAAVATSDEATQATAAVAPSHSGGLDIVRLGARRTVGDAGWLIALDRGYFAQQGIDLQLNEVSTSELVPGLASSHVDAAATAPTAGLYNAIGRGIGIKIVASQARMDPGASSLYIMVRQDLIHIGQFRDYADLRGKKVAIPARGSTPDFVLARALARGGLQPGDAEAALMDFPEMTTAFGSRNIDVGLQTEPTATASAATGVAVKWREVADVTPGLQNTIVLFGPNLLARPEVARRWMVAYLQGVRDYDAAFIQKGSSRPSMVAILIKWTPVTDAALYDQMGFPNIDANGRVSEASLRDLLDFYRAQGSVTTPVDLDAVIDSSIADAAVHELGAYKA